jgi:hypothetical protein
MKEIVVVTLEHTKRARKLTASGALDGSMGYFST